MRSVPLAVLLLVALAGSGCFAPGGALADSTPRVGVSDPLWFDTGVAKDEALKEDEYWLVYVQGGEEHETKSGPASDRHVECPEPDWLYRLDRDNRSLTYNPKTAKVDGVDGATILVVVDFFGVGFGATALSTGCPTDYRIDAFERSAETTVSLQNFGTADVKVFPQGHLGLMGANMTFVLPLGKGVGYEYTKVGATEQSEYWVFGRWHVQNLGAWPKSGLNAGS